MKTEIKYIQEKIKTCKHSIETFDKLSKGELKGSEHGLLDSYINCREDSKIELGILEKIFTTILREELRDYGMDMDSLFKMNLEALKKEYDIIITDELLNRNISKILSNIKFDSNSMGCSMDYTSSEEAIIIIKIIF